MLNFSSDSIFLANTDEQEITKVNSFSSRLSFESRFESGNLRKVIQVMTINTLFYKIIKMNTEFVNSPTLHRVLIAIRTSSENTSRMLLHE